MNFFGSQKALKPIILIEISKFVNEFVALVSILNVTIRVKHTNFQVNRLKIS